MSNKLRINIEILVDNDCVVETQAIKTMMWLH